VKELLVEDCTGQNRCFYKFTSEEIIDLLTKVNDIKPHQILCSEESKIQYERAENNGHADVYHNGHADVYHVSVRDKMSVRRHE
jgi:hypothetical protein